MISKTFSSRLLLLPVAALTINVWGQPDQAKSWADENLAAWAFLDFDPAGRTPDERAQMLKRLGLTKCGYEGHPRWISQLEDHIVAYRKHGIELLGIYLEIRAENPLEQDYLREAIEIFERQQHPLQLWLTVRDSLLADVPEEQRTEKVCDFIRPLADRVIPAGFKIAMYNHGGWTGLPNNQVQVIERLQTWYDAGDLGIVLNFHHAHPFVDQFEALIKQAQPYLFLVNTNGMRVKTNADGKQVGDPKILPLGQGNHEVDMLRVVKESGYAGPIGVIDHMKQVDPEMNLQNNLEALKMILSQLDGQ